MLDKRYQVFVSSTYEDLREERAVVMQALLELDCIPSGMELFPAADEDSWTLIKRVIDECDYYIVIVAGRYGSTNDEGVSYTEMEYKYALLKERPIIGFLHNEPGKIIKEKSEGSPEGQERLEKFRELVQRKSVKFWTTPEGLGGVVSRGIANLIKTRPAVGWVRADTVDPNASQEILRLQKENEKLRKLTMQGLPGTEGLSQGEDVYAVQYHYHVKEKYIPNKEYEKCETEGSGKYDISWNEIIANVGPYLLDYTGREKIKQDLEKHIQHVTESEILADVSFSGEVDLFSISDQHFQTIIIQLTVLGVIEKYSNRDIWKLTEHGERLMVSLRAIRKGEEKFRTIEKKMSELIAEMREDLQRRPLDREFVLSPKRTMYSGKSLVYCFDEHDDLQAKIHILENNSFIIDKSAGQTKRYRMTEEFVRALSS